MGAKAAPIPLALGTKEKIEVSYADLVGIFLHIFVIILIISLSI